MCEGEGKRGERRGAAHLPVSCHSAVEIWNDFSQQLSFYVLVPDNGDNYICLSEVPGNGMPGTLGITGYLEGTHHLMDDLQALPGVLMAPSQSTHTDPSMTRDLPKLETPVWAETGVILPPEEATTLPLSPLGLSPEAETAPGSPVIQSS